MSSVGKSNTVKQSNAVKVTVSKVIFEGVGVYINPLTDFGFKRIFGTEANKDLLIDFLNVVLNLEDGIKELYYTNPEKQGRVKTDPKAVFDLHCVTRKGERILIEMQKLSQEYYKDRALYYASFPIQEQGEKKKKWDYLLKPVYSVNVVNFKLDKARKTSKYTSYIQLTDIDTQEVFYDKLMFVYLELPRFTKKIAELETNVERWMYVLRNLPRLNDLPEVLRGQQCFRKLFEQAKIANMTKEELDEYQESLKNYRDMYLIEDQYKRKLAEKDKILATMQKTYQKTLMAERKAFTAEREAHQKALSENAEIKAKLAELERRYRLN